MRDEADAGCGSRNRATTKSSEDYVEAILVIRRERGHCRNIDIAERLGFSKASVSKALASLAAEGLVEVVERDVLLTEEGERAASATLERHRFFERPLVESGVDARTASAEACRMEHCQADELAAALSRLPKVQLRRLLMHAVAQLPVREIARREGCSERAVKYSLARARRRMRALLTDGD